MRRTTGICAFIQLLNVVSKQDLVMRPIIYNDSVIVNTVIVNKNCVNETGINAP